MKTQKKFPYIFQVNTLEEYRNALLFVSKVGGLEINDGDSVTTVEGWVNRYPFEKGKFVGANNGQKRVTSWSACADHPHAIEFSNNAAVGRIAKEWFSPEPPITVDNVGEYTATITETGVSVGCQIISFEKVAEITEAIKKFQSQ